MPALANNKDALQSAAAAGQRDTVESLLDRGADIHANNERALRGAASNGQTDTVALLLDRGADIHAVNDAALRLAAGNGRQETVALLLDHGADIHANDDQALQWAAESEEEETVKLLLANGADPTKIPDDGTLASVLSEIRTETAKEFTRKPARAQCFQGDEQHRLSEHVFLSCGTRQFRSLICAPLIVSKAPADRRLFQDIWDALPSHWQDEYQNLLMSFVKEGGLKPVLGPHGGDVHRRDSEIQGLSRWGV